MEKDIQAMVGQCLKLLVCFLVLLNTQVRGYTEVNITILHSAVEKGAVCLDGSPPAYYHDQGYGEGANNWVVLLQGGGWCYNDTDCLSRLGFLASSSKMNTSIGFEGIFSQNNIVNPDLYNWNRVFVAYCDGASFAGDIEEVNPETNIHHRGARIFNAIIEDLLAKGMKNANNAILAGQSAGGLAAMLHCDQFRAQLPNTERVKCLSDGGYFIQGKDIPEATEANIEQPYADIVAYHGMDKLLPKSCTSKMDKKSCLYPENFIGDIQTPIFLINSAFDQFQRANKVNVTRPTRANDFRTAFLKALPKGVSSLGMFIDACGLHDHIPYARRWNSPNVPLLKNKTIAQAFGDWYFNGSYFQEIDYHDTPRICPI